MAKRKPKAETQRGHARRRAMERYDLNFTDDVRREFLRVILGGRSVPVCRQSHRVVIHDVTYQDVVYRVVYDKDRKEIVTFLLPHWSGLDEAAW